MPDAPARMAAAGIHSLTLETPYPVGSVNAYVVEGEPLTLVDCGPREAVTRESLEAGLAAIGRSLADIELLLLTHQHLDHHGMAHDLVDEFGVEVACLDLLASYLEQWPESCAADETYRAERMRRHGAPQASVTALEARAASRIAAAGTISADRRLSDGDLIDLGQIRLRVSHRPGHSPSDTVFWAEERGVALVGDHLLLDISANPLMALGLPPASSRFRPLLEYRRSLALTKETAFGVCLTGHGPPVVDHVGLVEKRLAGQDARSALIEDALRRSPGQTAWEIALGVFGSEVATRLPMLCLSEAIAHLERLEEETRVFREGLEPVRFVPA